LRNKTNITISLFIIGILIFSVIIYSFQEEEIVPYCGTEVYIDSVGEYASDELKNGKALYNIHCASCHKIDRVLIGPALGNIKLDSLQLYNVLIRKDTSNIVHNPVFNQLTISDTNQLLAYIKVDAIK